MLLLPRVARNKQRLRCLSTFASDLSGLMNSTSTGKFYAKTLKMSDKAIKFFTQPKIFWEAVQKDAKLLSIDPHTYLHNICSSFDKFFDSGELCDRGELRDAITAVLARQGQFVCVLGGKSVGKSLVAHKIEAEQNNSEGGSLVLIVDGRKFGKDLVKGALKYFIFSRIPSSPVIVTHPMLLCSHRLHRGPPRVAKAGTRPIPAVLRADKTDIGVRC
jgi:hypothetical protein